MAFNQQKFIEDVVAVFDEHGVDFLSCTVTESKARRHGQVQFEENLKQKQEKLPLGTTEKVD